MNWIDKIIEAGEFKITAFEVTDMDFFGPPTPEKLAFYKGKLEATNKKGVKVASNICNNRGGCTAILIVVTAKIKKQYKKLVAMVEQDRLPSGGQRIECVAGMKDLVTGSVKAPVIQEILQELPIDDIKEDDPRIFTLGKIWPSPGWSDEEIDLWAGEFDIDEEKYNYLKAGTFGEGAHEVIKVHFYEYDYQFNDDHLAKIDFFKFYQGAQNAKFTGGSDLSSLDEKLEKKGYYYLLKENEAKSWVIPFKNQ